MVRGRDKNADFQLRVFPKSRFKPQSKMKIDALGIRTITNINLCNSYSI